MLFWRGPDHVLLQGFAIGKKLIEDAFVYHFTAETKPLVAHF